MRPKLIVADPELPRRRRQPIKAVFDIFFAENCIKMKDIGLKGGARRPRCPTSANGRERVQTFNWYEVIDKQLNKKDILRL